MKTMKTWMMMLAMVMTAGLLTSCEEDRRVAFKLDGAWYGDFGMNYTYLDRYGRQITVDSYDTYLKFYNDGITATHGWGKQVDYYRVGPYERLYYRFEWRIRDGIIHITYPSNPELSVDIYDYTMRWGHFTGWFGNSDIRFDLRSLSEDYDWDIYKGNYYEYCYDGWRYDGYGWYETYYGPYWAPTRAASGDSLQTAKADSLQGNAPQKGTGESRIVKVGNRYMNSLNDLTE